MNLNIIGIVGTFGTWRVVEYEGGYFEVQSLTSRTTYLRHSRSTAVRLARSLAS